MGFRGFSSGERGHPRAQTGGPNSKSGGMGGLKIRMPPVTKRGVSKGEGSER